jgi:MFS family permease
LTPYIAEGPILEQPVTLPSYAFRQGFVSRYSGRVKSRTGYFAVTEIAAFAMTAASRRPVPWSAFHHSLFTVVWVATVISNLGSWVSAAASGWLMTALNPDPFVVSLIQVATNLPLFVLALPAGALTDIVDRRRLLLCSEVAILGSSVALALLVSNHRITSVGLLLMTALISAAAAVGAPPWQAVVTELVPRTDLPSAVSLNSLGINISRAVGPALGGLLVSALGYGPPFWIDAFSNAGVIAALMWWKHPPKARPELPSEALGSAMMLGLRHARYNPHLSATLLRAAAFFVFASAYWALLPVIARAQVGAGPSLYGGLLAAIGAGAIGGAALVPRLKDRWGANRLVAWCTLGTAGATGLFALSHHPAMSLAASMLAGVCWIGAVSSLNLSAQVALPEWVRGRGLAVYVTVMFGALSIGGMLWGELASAAGVSSSLLAAAAGAALSVPLVHKWQLQTGEGVDFTPALHWPSPITVHEVHGDRGPVLVSIEYRIDPRNRARFLQALFGLAPERRRDGAYSWKVFEDPAVDGRFIETFQAESWREHLRHHSRVTKSDQLHEEALRWCMKEHAPVTTHLIQVLKPE